MKVELELVKVEKDENLNIIIGQSHFIKSVEDIYDVIVASVPSAKFGLAFCESSGKCLIRSEGNDAQLKKTAEDIALKVGCGHTFFILLKDAFQINILNQIKNIQEVCRIFCATANSLQVIVAKTSQGRGILGVIDGLSPQGIEGKAEVKERKELLRKFGYKL